MASTWYTLYSQRTLEYSHSAHYTPSVAMLTTLASWGWLAGFLAALRTRDESPSRPGPNGRLRCGRGGRPKSPSLRLVHYLPRLEAHMRTHAGTHAAPLPPPGPQRELVVAHHPLRAGGFSHFVRALLRLAASSPQLAAAPLPHKRFGSLLAHHVQPMMQRLRPPPPYDNEASEQLRGRVAAAEASVQAAKAAAKAEAATAAKAQVELEAELKAELEAELERSHAELERARVELEVELKVELKAAAKAKAAAAAASEQRATDAEARATRRGEADYACNPMCSRLQPHVCRWLQICVPSPKPQAPSPKP